MRNTPDSTEAGIRLPDFSILSDSPVSRAFVSRGIQSFSRACSCIQNLPYGRTSSRCDILLVLEESRGTCSGKHALLKKLAEENAVTSIDLRIGIYKMTALNTPRIAKILPPTIPYLPEAHAYLACGGHRFDFTRAGSRPVNQADILLEISLTADEMIRRKEQIHRDYLARWCERNHFEFSAVWEIREACIAGLSADNAKNVTKTVCG